MITTGSKFKGLSLLVTVLTSAALLLTGCNGGSDGAPGAPGATGATGAAGAPGKNLTSLVNAATIPAAQWMALTPTVDPASISVDMSKGTPVVKFTVTDGNGNGVVGLGGQSKSSTALVPSNYNISFTLAKLVPGTNGEPSKWLNYGVIKPGTVAAPATVGTYPSADSQGTMVDNGDGSYQYTFWRDVTKVASIVAGLTDDATHFKADLGDVSYDATKTHRLGIIISGSQPGTGTATPTAVQAVTPVPLVNPFNIGFDFVPNGSPVTVTRNIVQKESCASCHDNGGPLTGGRGIGHISTSSATNGIPAGRYVGRYDPMLCVTCHTDQTKYGFAQVTATTNPDGSPAYSGAYYRTLATAQSPTGEAAFTYPRMIHQTHMGSNLVKTGYNLNNHCSISSAPAVGANGVYGSGTITGTNLAQCFNLVNYPQDNRNCTKCHAGPATASVGATGKQSTAVQTKDGDNWQNVPSQLACGACHDGINFATGGGITLGDRDADVAAGRPVGTTQSGHIGGAKADNSQCAVCHDAPNTTTKASIAVGHSTFLATPNNPKTLAGVSTISYNLKSVSVNSSGNPVFVFQIIKDGAPVTSLATAATLTSATSGAQVVDPNYSPFSGFVAGSGGPTLYFLFATPIDGIQNPADYTKSLSVSLASLMIASGSPKTGSVTIDGSGNITATITGDTLGQAAGIGCTKPTAPAVATCVNTAVLASPIVIPTSGANKVTMAAGFIAGAFVQTNVAGYAYTPGSVTVNPNVSISGGVAIAPVAPIVTATGFTGRRQIADNNKCQNCHEQLGTGYNNGPIFHNIANVAGPGYRNNVQICTNCHNAVTSTGAPWSINLPAWIHGIHGGSERTNPYTVQANFPNIQYPGLLRDCNQCHLPNTVNFGATASAIGNMIWPTVLTGTTSATQYTTVPYINSTVTPVGTNLGNGYSFTPAGATVSAYTPASGVAVAAHVAAAGGEVVQAASGTLVNSPIAGACLGCHDSTTAIAHMKSNGGAVYQSRATTIAVGQQEGCPVCHAANTLVDVAVVHQ